MNSSESPNLASGSAGEALPIMSAAEACIEQASTWKAWLALLSVAFGAFAMVTTEFLPAGILPSVATDLHISTGQAGLMVAVTALVGIFAAPLVAMSTGSMDRRKLLIGLSILMVLSNAMVALAPSFWLLLLGRFAFGIALSGFWTVAIALSDRLAPPGVPVARAISVIMMGVTLATIAGVPLGVWLNHWLGWRHTFMLLALSGVALLLIQLWALPSLKMAQAIRPRDVLLLVQHPQARIGLIATVLAVFAHFFAYTYIVPFYQQVGHFDATQIGTLILAFGVAGVVGNWLAGSAAARSVRLSFMAVIAIIGLVLALFPLLGTSFHFTLLLTVIWGLMWVAIPVCSSVWMFSTAADRMERGSSLHITAFQLGIFAASGLGGFLVDHAGVTAALWAGVTFALLTFVFIAIYGKGVK